MARRPFRSSDQIRWIVGVFVLVVTACSGGQEEAATEVADDFCPRAEEYLRFEPSLGRAANDPEQTQVFVAAWQNRLIALEDRAPDEIRDDVATIKESVNELDEELQEVGYDLLALSIDQLDGLDALADGEGSEADRRFRGYVDANCTAAPSPLTDDELAELVGDGDEEVDIEGEVTTAMAEDLEALLGISPEVSQCLVSNLEPNVLDELLGGVESGGGQMSEETVDALIGVIDLCGITAEDLVGG